MISTPVVFLVFNRPDVTATVFDAIAAARPKKLLVVADGPRPDRPGEAERCASVRSIVERIDWPCELSTKYSDVNLGCGRSVSGGLDWVFSQCERAIILEDDCLPHPDFFTYCEQLLDRYEDDRRIAHIGGDDFQGNAVQIADSYYFTRFPHVWGWATRREAWRHYDFKLTTWPARRDDDTMQQLFADPAEREFWRRAFDDVHSGRLDTWDVQWSYALLMNGLLAINPATNLISNLGFGNDATHTRRTSWMSQMATKSIGTLRHPETIRENRSADARTFEVVFDGGRFRQKLAGAHGDAPR